MAAQNEAKAEQMVGKAQRQINQTMQKASDQSDAAIGRADRTVDGLLGK